MCASGAGPTLFAILSLYRKSVRHLILSGFTKGGRMKAKIFLGLLSGLLFSCSNGTTVPAGKLTFAPAPANLRLSLTDAPIDHVTSVNVNVEHVELWLSGKGKQGRLILAKDYGFIDLLQYQNGALLPLADLDLPPEIQVDKIRIVLKHEGHNLVKDDGSICTMKTPSAQKTGLKINLKDPIVLETGSSYRLVVDFDAKKSLVLRGNGECLLKPVIKIASAQRVPSEDVNEDGTTDVPPEDVLPELPDNSDDNADGGDGYESGDGSGSGEPVVIVDDNDAWNFFQ